MELPILTKCFTRAEQKKRQLTTEQDTRNQRAGTKLGIFRQIFIYRNQLIMSFITMPIENGETIFPFVRTILM